MRASRHGYTTMGCSRWGRQAGNTRRSFVSAREVFVCTGNLVQQDMPQIGERQQPDSIVRKAIEATDGTDGRTDGWAPLSAVGAYMRKLDPAFHPHRSRQKNLSGLISSSPQSFRTRTDETETKDGVSGIHVKAVDRSGCTTTVLTGSGRAAAGKADIGEMLTSWAWAISCVYSRGTACRRLETLNGAVSCIEARAT